MLKYQKYYIQMLKYQNKLYPNAKTFKCYAKKENIIELCYLSLQISFSQDFSLRRWFGEEKMRDRSELQRIRQVMVQVLYPLAI